MVAISSARALARARRLVGVRFRAQGRNPQMGLDCAGLIIAAFDLPATQFPDDYRLSADHREAIEAALGREFRRLVRASPKPGDIVLLSVGARRVHLALHAGDSFIHADAAVGSVVETPGPVPWPVLARYRRRSGARTA